MTNMWSIKWRGTITRDIGWEVETADNAEEAKRLFQSRHPGREIVTIDSLEVVGHVGDKNE